MHGANTEVPRVKVPSVVLRGAIGGRLGGVVAGGPGKVEVRVGVCGRGRLLHDL